MADDRTYATWKAVVDAAARGAGHGRCWYLVSDRAKALIQLAEQGLECLSMPDFFHLVHEIVKSYSLAMGQRLRQAHQELTHAEEVLARRHGARAPSGASRPERPRRTVEARRAEVTAMGRRSNAPIGHHLETLSLTLHPFGIADSDAPDLCSGRTANSIAAVEAIEALAQRHQLPARHDAMNEGPQAAPGAGRAGGLLVARGATGLGAICACRRSGGQWVHELASCP